jgi:hypothetical protein
MNADRVRKDETGTAEDAELRALLRRGDEPFVLPGWFVPQLMHRVRREARETGAMAGAPAWLRWLDWLLRPGVAVTALLMALLIGAAGGYWFSSDKGWHTAEVRYLDSIDPVHRHP